MPTFDTPEPISVTIDLGLGDIRIAASDRADTAVDVRPTNPARESDVRAAEQTRVEYAAGRLLVSGPKQRGLGVFGRPGSVDLAIELPAGSHLSGEAGAAAFHCQGRLGAFQVRTGLGDITVDRAAGPAEVSTGTGKIRLGGSTAERSSRTPTATAGSGRSPATCGRGRPTATSLLATPVPVSPPAPPAAMSGSARSCAARPRCGPAMARSRSASATALPPGSMCPPSSAGCTTTWPPRRVPAPQPKPPTCTPAPATATS